jgi:hypothetical protein
MPSHPKCKHLDRNFHGLEEAAWGGEEGWFGIGGIGYGTGLSKWEQNAMADPIELEMRTVVDDIRYGDELGGEEWEVRQGERRKEGGWKGEFGSAVRL